MRPRAVVVAHREAMVAEGIAAALARFPCIVPIAVATSAAESERSGGRAHAVAIDQQLPGATHTAMRLRGKGVRVVVLGDACGGDEEQARVSPHASVSCLAAALVPGLSAPQRSAQHLTPRERQVLTLIARGFAGKQVAKHLGISPKTVEQHKSRIFAKLGVTNQTAAVTRTLANGWERSKAWSPMTI